MSRYSVHGRFLGLIVALVLLLNVVHPLSSVSAQTTYVVKAPMGLNLRQDPSLSAQVILALFDGELVIEIGSPVTSGGITWRHIRASRGTQSFDGFASATFLVPLSDVPVELVVSVTAPAGLNLRVGPGLGFAVSRVVAFGTLLRSTGVEKQADGYTWLQVRVDGTLLWGAKRFLQQTGTVPSVERDVRVTAPAGLNLRTGSGLGFAVDHAVPLNTILRATGIEQQADGLVWAQIRVNGRLLWAAKRFLQPL